METGRQASSVVKSQYSFKTWSCVCGICVCSCLCVLRVLDCDKKSFFFLFFYCGFQSKKFKSHHIWPSPRVVPWKSHIRIVSFLYLLIAKKKKITQKLCSLGSMMTHHRFSLEFRPLKKSVSFFGRVLWFTAQEAWGLSQLLAGLELSFKPTGEFLRIPGWGLCSLVLPCSHEWF